MRMVISVMFNGDDEKKLYFRRLSLTKLERKYLQRLAMFEKDRILSRKCSFDDKGAMVTQRKWLIDFVLGAPL